MSTTATLSLKKLEEHFGIQDQLSNHGYYSIFDILKLSKSEFTREHQGLFGAKASKIYDTASGYATQIMLLFRKNNLAQAVQTSVSSTQLQDSASVALTKSSPTWQTLFADDWREYCQNGAPEAVDSPVAYLSWLYNQATKFESQMGVSNIIPLAARRPDLADLTLDNDAINQVVPSLQLVNEVLEQSITPYINNVTPHVSVSETLAATHYPTLLPYHYPHQQTLLSLEACDESLQNMIKKTDTAWPYFVKEDLLTGNAENALLLGSDLAPEQLSIITENTTIDADFYKKNFGMECDDYSIFKDHTILCRQLDISKQQLEKVLSCTEGGSSVVVSENYPDGTPSPAEYGAKYINQNASNPISFINNTGYDAVSDSASMVLNNTTIITGKLGDGIEVDATKNSEAYITDDFSVKDDSSADFCLTFWCKLPANVKNDAVIVTNKTGKYTGNSKGIALMVSKENNKVACSLSTHDGANSLKVSADILVDTWIFFCIAQDATNKKLTCYYSVDNNNMNYVGIDYTSLSSTALSNSYWGFNGNKGNEHYKNYQDQAGIMHFDDITAWDRLLTDDEINLFITSNLPAAGYTDMLHHYPIEKYHLGNLSDDRLNNIQQIVRLQRWVDLPYEQIDALINTRPVLNTNYSSMELKNIFIQPGKFGDGIRVDATVGAEAYFPDDVSVVNDVSADFSLAFWCKLPADVKDGATIITNKTGTYSGNAQGITLLAQYNDSTLHVTLNTSDGSTSLTQSVNIPTETWLFFCLCQDVTAKKVYCYYSTDGATLHNVCNDYSTLSSIALSNTYWGFNSNKDNTHYKNYPEQTGIMDFDDITVWNKKLAESEITKFITSNKPAAGYVTMVHNYSFDNLQYFEELNIDPRKITAFKHYQEKYNVTSQQFASVLDVISPYAITPDVPFWDQVFNSSSLFDEPLKINNTPFNYTALDGNDGQVVKKICAGLGITRAQFLLLANQVKTAQKMAENTLTCSLPVISALYRLVMVPRWLGLSFAEGVSLLMLVENGNAFNKLASVPLYFSPDDHSSDLINTLMALSDAAQWLADNNLTATDVLTMLQAGEMILPATTAELNFITDINQQLPSTLLNENSFSSLSEEIISESVYFPTGSDVTNSHNGAISYELNSTKGKYACLSDKANNILNPNSGQPRSLGMWCYIKNGASVGTPLIASATIGSDGDIGTGVAITLGGSYKLHISMYDENGKAADVSLDSAQWGKNETWFYISIRMPYNNMLYLDIYLDNGTKTYSSALDYSNMASCQAESNYWSINEDGSQQFYSTHQNSKSDIIISDVTVWQKNVLVEDFKKIIQSNRPANETVPGGLSFNKTTWKESLDNIIDSSGLVLPVATDYQTINSIVHNDLCYGTSESELNEVSNIIYQAKLAQQNIADNALAKAFDIDHSFPPYLFTWAASSEYDLLSQSLALNGITTPDAIPDAYQQYLYQLARRAGLSNTFNLTPAMLSTLLAHPAWFGVADVTIDFNLLYLFSRYNDWMKLADKEDAMLAYLRRANDASSLTPEQAASCLALLTDWESDEVLQAAAYANPSTGIAATLAHIDVVMRLKTLCTHTSTSVEAILNTGGLTTTSTYQEWQSVGESLVAAQGNN